ncbi:hypothetical protein LINPERPRIM_LOCUS5464 [Linum perenne]
MVLQLPTHQRLHCSFPLAQPPPLFPQMLPPKFLNPIPQSLPL